MKNRIGPGLGWGAALLGCLLARSAAWGQVVAERDTKLTGPRGRTIERSIRTERGHGYVDRQIEIKRPGGTLTRETRIPQPGGYPHRYGSPGGSPRPRMIERDVFVERPALITPFVAPFLSFSFGSPPPPPTPPPPPAVVYVPEPVYIAPPMVLAASPMVVAAPAYAPVPVPLPTPAPVVSGEPVMPPPLADAVGRLASLHHQSRRDGALTLGHLGDDRAVTPLMDRLEHDFDREVRVAAAWALGEIGDPRAGVALQRATLYDRRQEVRNAASTAYQRLPKPGQELAGSPEGPIAAPTATTIVSRPGSGSPPPSMVDPGPQPTPTSDVPPPFPLPSNPF